MHNIGDDREKLKRILPNGIKCDEVALLKTALTGRKVRVMNGIREA